MGSLAEKKRENCPRIEKKKEWGGSDALRLSQSLMYRRQKKLAIHQFRLALLKKNSNRSPATTGKKKRAGEKREGKK